MKLIYNLNQLPEVAKQVLEHISSKTLLFYGDMGVGKTTLIKELVHLLGVNDITSSPTFSLVNEYRGTDNTVFHFDFYRIDDEEEVLDIGIEDYFYSDAWCLVEWPHKIANLLPEDAVSIKISLNQDNSRTLEIIK
ncbi:tRNA (adenosine(37)-N6)-threonylcarbamoyltransferase complex ATPase subunit type 1 TsaE [Pseudofulvibacter geojedonensis]|uniref:tRNA threonylcarbamoyladenosine biosynthesis protein TsaE n=1 Tax=Pseudofulvibacter geojedonensis TaxID=1123758 RepID=A0ABW3HYR4_9FLAO